MAYHEPRCYAAYTSANHEREVQPLQEYESVDSLGTKSPPKNIHQDRNGPPLPIPQESRPRSIDTAVKREVVLG
jgi:hypothetical protein